MMTKTMTLHPVIKKKLGRELLIFPFERKKQKQKSELSWIEDFYDKI